MASFTRKAIMDSFMKLVDQRPISKITIKDIVEDCGVNRNTFVRGAGVDILRGYSGAD